MAFFTPRAFFFSPEIGVVPRLLTLPRCFYPLIFLICFSVSFFQGGHGSVRLRFVHGTVRAVLVFGSEGSFGEMVSRYFGRVL